MPGAGQALSQGIHQNYILPSYFQVIVPTKMKNGATNN
jgi:hypothetical protein